MRPPIIISNGGIVDELAKGCGNETTDQGVANKIMRNIHDLNRKKNATVAMIIKNKNAHSDTPCLYWRLSSDVPYGKHNNREGASINEVVDETYLTLK